MVLWVGYRINTYVNIITFLEVEENRPLGVLSGDFGIYETLGPITVSIWWLLAGLLSWVSCVWINIVSRACPRETVISMN